MSRDIAFLHRAVKLMPPINMAGLVDMNQVLDEMWVVAQDEMNFLAEAANMEEFARLNKKCGICHKPDAVSGIYDHPGAGDGVH